LFIDFLILFCTFQTYCNWFAGVAFFQRSVYLLFLESH
jgi:hypothetical protein